MFKTIPLRETHAGEELLQDDRIELLTKQIRRKFHLAESTIEKLTASLRQLSLEDLENLFEDIVDMNTPVELNTWIDEHLPEPDES